jgi:hypothetical protein
MRRDKRLQENETRYLAAQDRLRAKRQRKNSNSSSARYQPAVDGCGGRGVAESNAAAASNLIPRG